MTGKIRWNTDIVMTKDWWAVRPARLILLKNNHNLSISFSLESLQDLTNAIIRGDFVYV